MCVCVWGEALLAPGRAAGSLLFLLMYDGSGGGFLGPERVACSKYFTAQSPPSSPVREAHIITLQLPAGGGARAGCASAHVAFEWL